MNRKKNNNKVLVVDDSALMRRQLARILGDSGEWEVHTARDGENALELIAEIDPAVVTLDVHMPVMDGLDCLSRIMTDSPRPVVMVSSITEEGALATLEALELGAVDYLQKPDGTVTADMERVHKDLLARVRGAASARLESAVDEEAGAAQEDTANDTEPVVAPRSDSGVVLIGVSTGGPRTLESVLPRLPADFPWPVVVSQHMPASFTRVFAERMDSHCVLRVQEVGRPTPLEAGNIYIGRGDADVVISRRGGRLMVMPVPSDERAFWHPSVDRLVESALECLSCEELIGVLLTGMGDDGAAAMKRLHDGGGLTIAESEASCVVWGMPAALVEANGASRVLSKGQVAGQLSRWLEPATARVGEA